MTRTASSHERLVRMTSTAILAAIIIAFTFIPYVGYIVYGGLSITTLHIPVILGAIVLGPGAGLILGTVWGITCLIYAAMNGTADAIIFLNPLISVLPRILVGYLAGWYYVWLRKLFAGRASAKGGKTAAISSAVLTSAFGTLTNTVLVLTAIQLFGSDGLFSLQAVFKNIISVAVTVNGIVELVAAIILCTAISQALFRGRVLKSN